MIWGNFNQGQLNFYSTQEQIYNIKYMQHFGYVDFIIRYWRDKKKKKNWDNSSETQKP